MHRLTTIAILASLSTAGCYSVQPIAAPTPAEGTRVALTISDAGRVALGGSMGPEVRRVDGKFLSKQDNDYLISVTGVNYLNGISESWQGETVRIKQDMVSGLQERKFSKGRTIAFMAGVAVVGVALIPKALGPSYRPEETPEPPSKVARRGPVRPPGGFQLSVPFRR